MTGNPQSAMSGTNQRVRGSRSRLPVTPAREAVSAGSFTALGRGLQRLAEATELRRPVRERGPISRAITAEPDPGGREKWR